MIYEQEGKRKLFLSMNLNHLLKEYGIDSKDLSLETGIPTTTISRLRNECSNPTLSSIEPLLNFFRVKFDDLLYEDMSSDKYQERRKMGELIHIAVYSLEELSTGSRNTKLHKFVTTTGITNPNSFGVAINSEVLAPAFQNNSIVILDPDLNPMDGDYVLCKLNDEPNTPPVFRQIFIDGNDLYFKPINPGFGDMKHFDEYFILGVVIKSIETYR
ncbi:MAG: putative HTH-type transcriptional regulator [Legionella sp.]|uniref:helix-turn-helix domain-containing protein n=1 Tax=Legionella sp. TaxID=459 RepID=UPI003D124B72